MMDNGLRGYVIAGRYTIHDRLEVHDSSTLYRGQDGETRAYVLLKHSGDASAAARQRFERECRRRANHPHMAHRLAWQWVDRPDPRAGGWEVFEWNGGRTLAGWLAEHNNVVEPRRAVEMLLPICRAVADLHVAEGHEGRGGDQYRLIHNYITLDDIGLRHDQQGHLQTFLRDYTTSYAESRYQITSATTWRIEQISGPGQFDDTHRRDAPTDVYALGEALYQLVTDRQPVSIVERRRDLAQVARADAVNPAVSRRLADAIEQAMALNPQQRFASPAVLGTALEEAIRLPARPATGNSTGEGGVWLVPLLAVAAIVAVFVMVTNSIDTPTATQPTPAGIGGGVAQPTPLPPTATPDAVATLTAADGAYVTLIGPVDGVVPATTDRPGDVLISESLTDFAVEAVFVNPDSPTWDYGFAFRHDSLHHFRLSVASDGTWAVTYCNEAPKQPLCFAPSFVGNGVANGLALGTGQTNRLRLLVAGTYGVVFVNEQQVALFNLFGPTDGSALFAAAGLRANANPTPVAYRDLIVRGTQ